MTLPLDEKPADPPPCSPAPAVRECIFGPRVGAPSLKDIRSRSERTLPELKALSAMRKPERSETEDAPDTFKRCWAGVRRPCGRVGGRVGVSELAVLRVLVC